MKKIIIFRLIALTFFCLPSLAIKSEQSFGIKKKCTVLSITQVIVEPRFEFASYEYGPLPFEDFIIKI